ncbi:MAG: EamA family transporter RarD [Peptostreptococcaceae bacterium]|nr:EamA family transporter RarD [Peptostreptococcaceae bacterium]
MENKNNMKIKQRDSSFTGVLYVTATYLFWGVQPIYWKQLAAYSAVELIANRIVWSFVFFMIILRLQKKIPLLKVAFKDKKRFFMTCVAGYLVSVNWLIYIYAVNTGQILATSLGYYICPLVSVILGMIFLKERFNKLQMVAFLLACSGVGVVAISYGNLPWIAVSLPLLFGVYGLFKKMIGLDAVVSMVIEIMAILPLGLGYMIYIESTGQGHLLSDGGYMTFMMLLTGVVTSLPLWWFAKGASMVKLSTIGFMQFLAPTISLIMGVLMYNEPFSSVQLYSFGLIWAAIAVFIYTIVKRR